MKRDTPSYRGYRFPPEIISHAVWLYHRFCLSFRDVEDLLAQRSIAVSYEAIRLWCIKFGPEYARRLKRRQGRLGDTWHLDEVFIKIQGIVLLPTSAPFLWRPLMVDPMYYPSTYEWDHSLVRLERFLVEHAEASDIVLTGDDTGEWIAALTGRRAYKVDSVLDRAEARDRRRVLRQLFLSGEPELMRDLQSSLPRA